MTAMSFDTFSSSLPSLVRSAAKSMTPSSGRARTASPSTTCPDVPGTLSEKSIALSLASRMISCSQEIIRLARLKAIDFEDKVPGSSAQVVLGEAILALPLEGVIDFAAERTRLGKELEKVSKDIAVIDGRLGNAGFVAKAPEDVLEETRERKAALAAQRIKLGEA